MDFKQLRAFAYVADLGSFTKAAAFLCVTQPALSRQIRLLEEDLSTRLFRRTGQGITLTTDGAALLDHAASLIGRVEGIKKEFATRAARSNATGVVSIGIPAPAARFFTDSFFEEFDRSCPGLSLRVVEGFSALIHEWLLSGSIDLAVLYGPHTSKVFDSEVVAIENLYAIGAATEQNQKMTSITLPDLAKHTLYLPHRPHILRDLIDSSTVHVPHIVEVDAISLMTKMAKARHGFTILPYPAVETAVVAGDVAALPIVQPTLAWQVSICHSKLRSLAEGTHVVLDLVRNEIRQLIRTGVWKSATLPNE